MRIKAATGEKVKTQSLGEFGNILAMRPQGRRVQEAIDALLRDLPPGGVLVLDFEGVEMMDYSFADEALGSIYSRMSTKEYPDKFLVLAATGDELGTALLENVEVALNRREVAALVLPKESIPLVLETLRTAAESSKNAPPEQRADIEWRVIGELPGHLVDTLSAVMEKYQITVRELAEMLNLDSATACNNRIAKLYQLHLVRREAAIVPEGGRLFSYQAIV